MYAGIAGNRGYNCAEADGSVTGSWKSNGKLQISAEGYDNRKIDSFVFYIREDSENPWTELAKVQAENNKATCVLGTTGYEDGQYFVKAEARDCAGNVSQNLFQRRYEIDNTGIAKSRWLNVIHWHL